MDSWTDGQTDGNGRQAISLCASDYQLSGFPEQMASGVSDLFFHRTLGTHEGTTKLTENSMSQIQAAKALRASLGKPRTPMYMGSRLK